MLFIAVVKQFLLIDLLVDHSRIINIPHQYIEGWGASFRALSSKDSMNRSNKPGQSGEPIDMPKICS